MYLAGVGADSHLINDNSPFSEDKCGGEAIGTDWYALILPVILASNRTSVKWLIQKLLPRKLHIPSYIASRCFSLSCRINNMP